MPGARHNCVCFYWALFPFNRNCIWSTGNSNINTWLVLLYYHRFLPLWAEDNFYQLLRASGESLDSHRPDFSLAEPAVRWYLHRLHYVVCFWLAWQRQQHSGIQDKYVIVSIILHMVYKFILSMWFHKVFCQDEWQILWNMNWWHTKNVFFVSRSAKIRHFRCLKKKLKIWC